VLFCYRYFYGKCGLSLRRTHFRRLPWLRRRLQNDLVNCGPPGPATMPRSAVLLCAFPSFHSVSPHTSLFLRTSTLVLSAHPLFIHSSCWLRPYPFGPSPITLPASARVPYYVPPPSISPHLNILSPDAYHSQTPAGVGFARSRSAHWLRVRALPHGPILAKLNLY
jgi:hypothetical protein